MSECGFKAFECLTSYLSKDRLSLRPNLTCNIQHQKFSITSLLLFVFAVYTVISFIVRTEAFFFPHCSTNCWFSCIFFFHGGFSTVLKAVCVFACVVLCVHVGERLCWAAMQQQQQQARRTKRKRERASCDPEGSGWRTDELFESTNTRVEKQHLCRQSWGVCVWVCVCCCQPYLLPVLRLTKTNEQSAHLTIVSRCLVLCCPSEAILTVLCLHDLQPLTHTLLCVIEQAVVWSSLLELSCTVCVRVVILMISSVGVSSGLLSGQDRVGGQTEDKCPHLKT